MSLNPLPILILIVGGCPSVVWAGVMPVDASVKCDQDHVSLSSYSRDVAGDGSLMCRDGSSACGRTEKLARERCIAVYHAVNAFAAAINLQTLTAAADEMAHADPPMTAKTLKIWAAGDDIDVKNADFVGDAMTQYEKIRALPEDERAQLGGAVALDETKRQEKQKIMTDAGDRAGRQLRGAAARLNKDLGNFNKAGLTHEEMRALFDNAATHKPDSLMQGSLSGTSQTGVLPVDDSRAALISGGTAAKMRDNALVPGAVIDKSAGGAAPVGKNPLNNPIVPITGGLLVAGGAAGFAAAKAAADKKALSGAFVDQATSAYDKIDSLRSNPDVQTIHDIYNKTIHEMNHKDERLPFGPLNNLSRYISDHTNGAAGGNYKYCTQQVTEVQRNLRAAQAAGQIGPEWRFDDQPVHWNFHMRLKAQSSNPNDPTITLDPWWRLR